MAYNNNVCVDKSRKIIDCKGKDFVLPIAAERKGERMKIDVSKMYKKKGLNEFNPLLYFKNAAYFPRSIFSFNSAKPPKSPKVDFSVFWLIALTACSVELPVGFLTVFALEDEEDTLSSPSSNKRV
jgi:hypothetical protein